MPPVLQQLKAVWQRLELPQRISLIVLFGFFCRDHDFALLWGEQAGYESFGIRFDYSPDD